MGGTIKDLCFNAFWAALALCIMGGSIRIGTGSLQNPGPGFTPLLFGACLALFAALNFVAIVGAGKKSDTVGKRFSARTWGNVGVFVAAVAAYGVFVESIGFVVTTLVIMAVLFQRSGNRLVPSMVWSLGITGASYFLFSYLGVVLPGGILRPLGL
jgi:hypothetical protein